MNPTPEKMDEPVDRVSDRALWQRCRLAEAPADESLRFLDLAAFAEGGLDPDEHDRIAAWLRVYGMVSPAPGFTEFPRLMNGASSLIQEVFGPEIGDHARVAIGVGALPFNVPVEIEAELELV